MSEPQKKDNQGDSTPPQPPPPPPPPTRRRDCPACAYVAPSEDTYCQACGIVFAKWIPPKADPAPTPGAQPTQPTEAITPHVNQQEKKEEKEESPEELKKRLDAQARLEALGQKTSTELSKKAKVILAFVVALPLAVLFVPDLNTRIFGGKLKYRTSKGQEIKFISSSHVTLAVRSNIEAGETPTVLNTTKTDLSTLVKVTGSNSGGNNTYQKFYKGLTFNSPLMGSVNHPSIGSWRKNWTMNAYGGTIATMGGAVRQMRFNADANKQHTLLRQQQGDEYFLNQFGGFSGSQTPAVPTRNDRIQTRLKKLFLTDLSALDAAHMFKFPKERLRSGDAWKQRMDWQIPAAQFSVMITKEFTFHVDGFTRNASGYHAIIRWEEDVDPKLGKIAGDVVPYLRKDQFSGSFKGKAWVRYSDGFVDRLESNLELLSVTSTDEVQGVAREYGKRVSPNKRVIVLSSQQTLNRTK